METPKIVTSFEGKRPYAVVLDQAASYRRTTPAGFAKPNPMRETAGAVGDRVAEIRIGDLAGLGASTGRGPGVEGIPLGWLLREWNGRHEEGARRWIHVSRVVRSGLPAFSDNVPLLGGDADRAGSHRIGGRSIFVNRLKFLVCGSRSNRLTQLDRKQPAGKRVAGVLGAHAGTALEREEWT